LINTRDDTVTVKPWAHKYLRFQRCLVPATGFFEWKKEVNEKIPYRFALKNKKYFSFAGLYSAYKHPKTNQEIKSYSIITTRPNYLMEKVHNRMPVILKEEDEQNWLNPDLVEIEEIKKFLNPYPENGMISYRVSKDINRPSNNSPEILKSIS
jgi:putative SOS response-associated peptidase YedK